VTKKQKLHTALVPIEEDKLPPTVGMESGDRYCAHKNVNDICIFPLIGLSKCTTGGASDIVKAKSSGEDPRATGGLVSNLPHPQVNKTKQHTSISYTYTTHVQSCTHTEREGERERGRKGKMERGGEGERCKPVQRGGPPRLSATRAEDAGACAATELVPVSLNDDILLLSSHAEVLQRHHLLC